MLSFELVPDNSELRTQNFELPGPLIPVLL